MQLVVNQFQSVKKKRHSRTSIVDKIMTRRGDTDDRAKQTGTEESGKFHFIPYLQDIDRDTGRDYAQ